MIQKANARYCAIEKALETDEEYLALQKALGACLPRFQAAMAALSEDERAVITEYLGICAEMEERIVVLACFVP